jgi:hypothetical protein
VARLANSRDGRRSGFTVMGTWAIGMCFFPAWMIVSRVYVKSVKTFSLSAARREKARKPLAASGTRVPES